MILYRSRKGWTTPILDLMINWWIVRLLLFIAITLFQNPLRAATVSTLMILTTLLVMIVIVILVVVMMISLNIQWVAVIVFWWMIPVDLSTSAILITPMATSIIVVISPIVIRKSHTDTSLSIRETKTRARIQCMFSVILLWIICKSDLLSNF